MSAGHACPICRKIFWNDDKFDDHLFGHGYSRDEILKDDESVRSYSNLPVPAWMLVKVQQLQSRVRRELHGLPLNVAFDGYSIVTIPLTEPREGASKKELARWDRSCDNCERWCPHPIAFASGTLGQQWDGVPILITYGACSRCLPEPGDDQ